ncbi:FAD-dependent monooxygenase [Streptomyces sp. NPDC057545]|uniref:FAD-dependent monooxygenase n=1 Tax=Streptomyces sp. NPDC057545 TaxID=3346164 RepID=UPI0036AE80F4
MPHPRVPVLIVGGSSVGLAASAFLAGHGIRSVLVEQRAEMSAHPRATSIGPRAWEALMSTGRTRSFLAVAERRSESRPPIKARTIAEFDPVADERRPDVSRSFVDAIAGCTPVADLGGCGQHQIDPVLLRAAEDGGAEVRWHTRMESLEQVDRGIVASVRDTVTGRVSVIEAKYVIAADGAESGTRELVGIGHSGQGVVGGYHINVLFRADLSELVAGRGFFSPGIVTHPDASGMLIALDEGDRWCYHIMVPEGEDVTPADYTEERCREVIRTGLGRPEQELEILSTAPWRPTARLADRFRAGRVFLAGDAARTLPPVGVFGLTTGICDAYNLAWKLAMVCRGEAGEGLLESYEAERRPRSAFLLDQVLRRMARPELHWGGSAEERGAAGVAEHAIAHLCDVYDSAAIVGARREPLSFVDARANLDGSPGTRVPHLWLERDGVRLSSVDLARGTFTLLAGADGLGWTEAARVVEKELGTPVAAVALGADPGIRVTEGSWEEAAGIGSSGALLVRPDGQVAWRAVGAGEAPGRELEGVLRQVLAR